MDMKPQEIILSSVTYEVSRVHREEHTRTELLTQYMRNRLAHSPFDEPHPDTV